MRVPRRHFSFHRHLTHVLRRPGRRREHFTFHFFSFNVYLCLLIMCFLCVCSSSLFFRVFFTRTRTKNQIKRYLETSARANQKAHEGGLFPLDGLEKKSFIQAHCFRRKSRSQTTNKKLFCSREREDFLRRRVRVRERERFIRVIEGIQIHLSRIGGLPLFSKKKAIGLRARRRRKRDANEGFEKRTQN